MPTLCPGLSGVHDWEAVGRCSHTDPVSKTTFRYTAYRCRVCHRGAHSAPETALALLLRATSEEIDALVTQEHQDCPIWPTLSPSALGDR